MQDEKAEGFCGSGIFVGLVLDSIYTIDFNHSIVFFSNLGCDSRCPADMPDSIEPCASKVAAPSACDNPKHISHKILDLLHLVAVGRVLPWRKLLQSRLLAWRCTRSLRCI